jgi:sec-independent protein translocase protein TatB
MLSIPHLIVIFVIALVIFGPEKLPELARNMGKLMAEFRRATSDIRGTFETHLRDLEREAGERRIDSATPARNTGAAGAAPAQPANSAAAQANAPTITAAEGTVVASAPHEAAVAAAAEAETPAASAAPAGQPLGNAPTSSGVDQHMMFPEDPEELIRQAEAQIARERTDELENPERVSDGAIGKP